MFDLFKAFGHTLVEQSISISGYFSEQVWASYTWHFAKSKKSNKYSNNFIQNYLLKFGIE